MESKENRYPKLISDPRLKEKTGKSWQEWFDFLDRFHAMGLNQNELLVLLKKNFKLRLSWQKALVMTFENEKKGCLKAFQPSEYEAALEKTFDISLPALYNLWSDSKLRNTWFPVISCCVIRENQRKYAKLLWPDSISMVELTFSKAEKNASKLHIRHSHLTGKTQSSEMEAYWNKVLEKLEETVTLDLFHTVILDI